MFIISKVLSSSFSHHTNVEISHGIRAFRSSTKSVAISSVILHYFKLKYDFYFVWINYYYFFFAKNQLLLHYTHLFTSFAFQILLCFNYLVSDSASFAFQIQLSFKSALFSFNLRFLLVLCISTFCWHVQPLLDLQCHLLRFHGSTHT